MRTHTHLPTRAHTMSYCLTPVQTIPTLQQQPKLLVLIITPLAENISRPLILVWLLLCWVWPTLHGGLFLSNRMWSFSTVPCSQRRARQDATDQTNRVMQTYKHAFPLADGKLLWKVIWRSNWLLFKWKKRKRAMLWCFHEIFWNINLMNLFNWLESVADHRPDDWQLGEVCSFVLHLNNISSKLNLCVVATQVHFVPAGNEGPSGASISVRGGSGSHLFHFFPLSQYSPALLEFFIRVRLKIAEEHKTWESENMWRCDPQSMLGERCKSAGGIYSIPRTSTGSVVFNLERDKERKGGIANCAKTLGVFLCRNWFYYANNVSRDKT